MLRELQLNPTFGSRKWVKLWVNEWLDGTTRGEMTDAQRAFFIDLLAMAGRSRFPGIICAGKVNDEFVGYPLNKFQGLMSEPIDVMATLELFELNSKIKVEVTRQEPNKLYKITLLNWERYQSEYQRQKYYRELQKGDKESYKPSYREGDTTEVEVRSKKLEGEEKKNLTPREPRADALSLQFKDDGTGTGNLQCKACGKGTSPSRAAMKQHTYVCPAVESVRRRKEGRT